MKKIISVLLSVVLAFGCMALTASAALEFDEDGYNVGDKDNANMPVLQYKVLGSCRCHGDGSHTGDCNCCVLCPNIPASKLSNCARSTEPIGIGNSAFDGYLCCTECTGMWGCNCGCACCGLDHDQKDNENTLGDIWGEEEQENFIDAFQSVLKRISDAFDKFFDAIFAFLRLDEVLGRN